LLIIKLGGHKLAWTHTQILSIATLHEGGFSCFDTPCPEKDLRPGTPKCNPNRQCMVYMGINRGCGALWNGWEYIDKWLAKMNCDCLIPGTCNKVKFKFIPDEYGLTKDLIYEWYRDNYIKTEWYNLNFLADAVMLCHTNMWGTAMYSKFKKTVFKTSNDADVVNTINGWGANSTQELYCKLGNWKIQNAWTKLLKENPTERARLLGDNLSVQTDDVINSQNAQQIVSNLNTDCLKSHMPPKSLEEKLQSIYQFAYVGSNWFLSHMGIKK
jgi:hypothetical protein